MVKRNFSVIKMHGTTIKKTFPRNKIRLSVTRHVTFIYKVKFNHTHSNCTYSNGKVPRANTLTEMTFSKVDYKSETQEAAAQLQSS